MLDRTKEVCCAWTVRLTNTVSALAIAGVVVIPQAETVNLEIAEIGYIKGINE